MIDQEAKKIVSSQDLHVGVAWSAYDRHNCECGLLILTRVSGDSYIADWEDEEGGQTPVLPIEGGGVWTIEQLDSAFDIDWV